MPDLWYRALLRAVTMIYYRRVCTVHLASRPAGDRPVLFVGLHRNGAVDGMLYKRVFPRAVFIVARQLLRSRFARLFFTGIPVAREQDANDAHLRRENPRALAAAVDHLANGGQLFVLPEGTSDLGPRHLPFKPGAARILLDTMERGVTPLVIPVGVFYESAPSFRSDACVVVGTPIDVTLSPSIADRGGKIAALMERLTASLEAIAVEGSDATELHRIETLAALASASPWSVRWRVQRLLSACALPPSVEERWDRADADIRTRRLAVDRAGVPRFSKHGLLWNAAWYAIQLLLVTLACAANLPPLAGAWFAGKRLADAPNTLALWRMLVGAPLVASWWLAVITFAVAASSPWLIVAYVAITILGLIAYPELCARLPMLRNALHRRSREDVDNVADWVRAADVNNTGAHV